MYLAYIYCGLFLFFLNNNVLFSNFNDDFNQTDCTNVIHDGKRFKWISNWETLKNFIEYSLPLKGRWTSPGGSSRKFTCKNLDLTITWYPGKQNSLILHGKLSTNLSNILLKGLEKIYWVFQNQYHVRLLRT